MSALYPGHPMEVIKIWKSIILKWIIIILPITLQENQIEVYPNGYQEILNELSELSNILANEQQYEANGMLDAINMILYTNKSCTIFILGLAFLP